MCHQSLYQQQIHQQRLLKFHGQFLLPVPPRQVVSFDYFYKKVFSHLIVLSFVNDLILPYS